MLEGLRASLEQAEATLHVEWLDARRKEGVGSVAAFERFLLEKYGRSHLDMLVAADNAAFDSLRRFRAALDPALPLVFCGVNNATPAMLAGESDLVGVSETVDITATVNLGLGLFPKTSHLAVIADSTRGGLANLDVLRQVTPGFPRSLAVPEFVDVKYGDLAGILGGLPRDTLLLVLGVVQGPDGVPLPVADSMAALSAASPFPVLTCWDFEVGAGALGGVVVSGLEQGRAAGGLVRRILAGEAVESLPRILKSPDVPMIDAVQLRRFGRSLSDLPPGVVVVNRQETLYTRYRGLVWTALAVFAVMAGCILALALALAARKRAVTALVASEARYRTSVDSAPTAIFIADTAGWLRDVNPAACHMTGWSREELLAKNIADVLDPASREEGMRGFAAIDAQARTAEVLGRTKDGTPRWWSIAAVQLAPDRVLGFVADVTERKAAEARLRDSETRYKLLAEQAPISIMAFDAKGVITFVNKRHLDVFAGGRKAPEFFLGRGLLELPGIVGAGIADKLEPLLRGVPIDLEAVYFPEFTGGHAGYVNLRGVPLHHEDGTFAGGILIREDVTARIGMERSLTAARNAAEAASLAKSAFLANMSHEIRTPLNGVLGMLQLLAASPLSSEQAEYAALAIQSSKRLTRLLSDILDLSRVEAGKMQIQAEPFQLSEALRQVLALFNPISQQTGVFLTSHIDVALPAMVVGDAARLQQVLTNLIGNAFKFTTTGSVVVEAYPLPSRRAGEVRILFSVADTGCGIPDADLKKLFEPFTQASQGLQRNVQGAGLGLSICQHLISLMGGSIAVDSEPGQGTTFLFCVTLGRVQALAGQLRPAGGPADQLRPLRVLLVEDDRVTRLVATRLLEKFGHGVTVAENGRRALDVLAEGEYDLVLMDIQMPEMDGLEATATIRNAPRFAAKAAIPIVAMTAYAMAGDRERFLASGMDDYVAKPVSIEDLRAAIERAMTKASAA